MRYELFAAAALMITLTSAAGASAQAGIRVVEVDSIRVDGNVGDWRGANFTAVGRGPDASMRFALGHDGEGLYVAAEVWDERVVRTPRPGAREDAVILTLAMPRGRRHRGVDVYLFAGVSGRSAGSAGVAPVGSARVRPLSGARVVEGPLSRRGRGYTLEAFVPFSAIPGGARWDRARASIRLRDVDSEAHPDVESEPALVEVDPRHLDRLVPLMPSGGASGALEEFLSSRGLGAARPRHDLRGDVTGDARPERVFVVDRFVLVTGPGFRDGGYAYQQLAVDDGGDVRHAELRDLTGDGKAELVVVLRQRNAQGERDLWQVMDLSGQAPRAIFGIEVRKAVSAGSVEARVRVARSRGRRPPQIEVRAHRARGIDADSYQENPAQDAEPMLLPWGPIRARRYQWDGESFERTGEDRNPRYREPAATPSRGRGQTQTPQQEAAPEAPSTGALLAEFRRRHGIRRGARSRFSFRANLAGDRAPEQVHVYGRRLVAVGPGIQDGSSWLTYEIPAPNDADLLDVSAADVTGDRRAELLFRIRQRFDDVQREILLVHQITDQGFPRILQAEVARERGSSRLENEVRTRGGRLEIHPGRATGFGEGSWPFTQDPNDSVDPLLLPWRDRPVRYRLRGGRLTR